MEKNDEAVFQAQQKQLAHICIVYALGMGIRN